MEMATINQVSPRRYFDHSHPTSMDVKLDEVAMTRLFVILFKGKRRQYPRNIRTTLHVFG